MAPGHSTEEKQVQWKQNLTHFQKGLVVLPLPTALPASASCISYAGRLPPSLKFTPPAQQAFLASKPRSIKTRVWITCSPLFFYIQPDSELWRTWKLMYCSGSFGLTLIEGIAQPSASGTLLFSWWISTSGLDCGQWFCKVTKKPKKCWVVSFGTGCRCCCCWFSAKQTRTDTSIHLRRDWNYNVSINSLCDDLYWIK